MYISILHIMFIKKKKKSILHIIVFVLGSHIPFLFVIIIFVFILLDVLCLLRIDPRGLLIIDSKV